MFKQYKDELSELPITSAMDQLLVDKKKSRETQVDPFNGKFDDAIARAEENDRRSRDRSR